MTKHYYVKECFKGLDYKKINYGFAWKLFFIGG